MSGEPTKAELLEQNEKLQAELAELRARLDKPTPAVKPAAAPSAEYAGGWMVRTANPQYVGVTCGIQFKGGMAIVDSRHPQAAEIVRQLENDFGYLARPITAAEKDAYYLQLAGVQVQPQKSIGEKLVMPAGGF